MKNYSSAELKELAVGVFKDDPKAVSVFADLNGTFKNHLQYALLSDEDKALFEEFKNPNIKEADVSEAEEKLAQVLADNKKLTEELAKVKDEKETLIQDNALLKADNDKLVAENTALQTELDASGDTSKGKKK